MILCILSCQIGRVFWSLQLVWSHHPCSTESIFLHYLKISKHMVTKLCKWCDSFQLFPGIYSDKYNWYDRDFHAAQDCIEERFKNHFCRDFSGELWCVKLCSTISLVSKMVIALKTSFTDAYLHHLHFVLRKLISSSFVIASAGLTIVLGQFSTSLNKRFSLQYIQAYLTLRRWEYLE